MDDDAAAYGTIRTGRARFCRARYLQGLRLRTNRRKTETED